MAKDWAKGFYASDKWHRAREGYISVRRGVDGGLCEECHEALGYIVHHKQELTPINISDPNISLTFKNLEYVCKACHDRIHDFGRQDNTREIRFDASGNPIPPIYAREASPPCTDAGLTFERNENF